jgi:hypothetical protein
MMTCDVACSMMPARRPAVPAQGPSAAWIRDMPIQIPLGTARRQARHEEAVRAAIDAAGGQVTIDPPTYPMDADHIVAFRLTNALAKAGKVHVYVFPDADRSRLDACYVCARRFGDDIHGKRAQAVEAPVAE